MRALHSFTVRPRVPPALAPLEDLARNLRWAWDRPTQELFRRIDPSQWDLGLHDPVALLSLAGRRRLEALAADADFVAAMTAAHDDLRRHLQGDMWFQTEGHQLRCVAYFSPEFGIAEALPQYSGGLGVLAGDHLKAASGLGVPIVAVGLLYRQGYFRQGLAPDGWQEERYVTQDPQAMALASCEPTRV